tara:strand:- start:32756 stop:33700 length:945 start_codon:yes stop_codon:yes gene_type:complete
MAIFSGFNQLNSKISNAFVNVRQTTQTINNFSANIGRTSSQATSFMNGNNAITRNISEITDTVRNVQNLFGIGNVNASNVGSSVRMIGNAVQNVGYNAAPPDRAISRAVIQTNTSLINTNDWRVSISVPSVFKPSAILQPLFESDNKMIFPFTPSILIGHSANYSPIQPTHTNFPFQAYENSQVDAFTITGEFFNENEEDARYWIACLHFLRSVTKMFYGESSPIGNPPPIVRLNGYGNHVLNNIPVVITNFTTDLSADVDYIECVVDGQVDYVPVQSSMTVQCTPNYARRSVSRFSLNSYVGGGHTGGPEGFV